MADGDLDPVFLSAAAKADALRAAGLAGLSGVTEARQAALERERGRLAVTLGADHPRVQALVHRIEEGAGRLRELGVQIARAKTVVPQVGEAEWAVHGHVRRADGSPVPDVTVLLVDAAGAWQRALGYACSDADGYFRLVTKAEPARAAPAAARVHLRVIGADRRELYRAEDALVVTPRAVEYREIVLHEDRRGCVSPEEDLPAGEEKTPPPEEPPPPRGKRSRRKG